MENEHSEQLEMLYRQHFQAMVVHAYRYMGDWERATEAAQEAFRIACEKPEDLIGSPNPIGWLKNTTKYVCMNILKQQRFFTKVLVPLESLDESELLCADDAHWEPTDELSDVADQESIEILKMIFLQGHSYREAAEVYGISVWACYKRVQRTVKKIKKIFGDMSKMG